MPVVQDLTVEDVVFDSRLASHIRSVLNGWRGTSRLTVYGKTDSLILSPAWDYAYNPSTKEDAAAFATWITKSWEHAFFIESNMSLLMPLMAADVSSDTYLTIRHAGIQSSWSRDDLHNNELFRVKVDALTKLFDGKAVLLSEDARRDMGWNADRAVWQFVDEKFSDNYFADSSQPLMVRTKWFAARKAWTDSIGGISYSTVTTTPDKKFMLFVLPVGTGAVPTVQIPTYRRVMTGIMQVDNQPSSPALWRENRNEVIRLEAQANGTDDAVLRQLKYDNYEKFWDDMKQSKRAKAQTVDKDAVEAMWATIPIADNGTESSRGWGIEIETVRAHQTSRPRGWADVYDGSLPDGSGGDCSCDCDDCYNDNHCNTDDDGCEYSNGESREFVSPILRYFNSNGLRQLCNDLGDDEPSSAPGIHVHVGAENLTVTDVARVLFAYGVVSPFIEPLYHRKVFGYCQEMPGNNVQWWLTAAKRRLQETGRVPRPVDICFEQPVGRYHDVNTHALAGHGTLEFRSMGPFYNYDHLVRWAWFCREMLNVSRLNLDQRVWTSCESLTDVISVLRKYGSEFPADKSLTTGAADTNSNTYEE